LTLVGIFPALAFLGLGQFGFLEIIGVIILIGIVENVAIFLIDLANQKIKEEGWDAKRAISYASGVRLRPVVLTSLTAVASLAPLALFSEFYRSISLVIIFGILTSGVASLITTPILFSFFKSLGSYLDKLVKNLTGKNKNRS
jgi:multidrug efflux pump subunit AcrB